MKDASILIGGKVRHGSNVREHWVPMSAQRAEDVADVLEDAAARTTNAMHSVDLQMLARVLRECAAVARES